MPINLLSATECKNATSNGANIRKLHDGDGLYLWVYLDGRKYWRMRYWQVGMEKSLSVGVYPKVSLSEVPPVFRLPRGGGHATSFSFC